jgi:hypothetical protein
MIEITRVAFPLRAIAAASLAALLVACGGALPPPLLIQDPSVWEYRVNTQGRVLNYGRWYNYIQSDGPCNSGSGFPVSGISPASCWNFLTSLEGPSQDEWVVSQGPWWIDPNHQQLAGGNGFGFINVIAFMRMPSAIKAGADLSNTEISFDAITYSGFSTVTAPSKFGEQKSHVWLWFETAPRPVANCTPNPTIGENCTRQSDYILTGDLGPDFQIEGPPFDKAVPRRFTLDPTKAANWTCLGTGKNVKYDCLPFEEAVKQVATIGFIAGPVLNCPVVIGSVPLVCDLAAIRADTAKYFNVGQIAFRNFGIQRPVTRNTVLNDIAWQAVPDGARASIEGWSPIQYGPLTTFKPGGGMRLQPGDGYSRFGLAKVDTTQDFSRVGPQVYIANWPALAGRSDGQIRVVDATADGVFSLDSFVVTYQVGDAVDMMVTADALLVLKNGEVVYRFPTRCETQCSYHPFTSQMTSAPGQPPLIY